MKNINIGLIGCGTIGTGVANILKYHSKIIKNQVGINLNLIKAADIAIQEDKKEYFKNIALTKNAEDIINDPDIDIIVEAIGGTTYAKEFILKAINNKKHIVTANKALLATDSEAIFAAALENGVDIAYEASVGGCIPIIKCIRESLSGERINSITGILNGTCNYILSKMANEKEPFEKALLEAQQNGFAEADPSFDIEGIDTAHKTAIIASLAFGTSINFNDIYIEGISAITPTDIDFANELGYTIKLLSICKDLEDKIDARVHPTMLPKDNVLSGIEGAFNAVKITGDSVGDMMLYGKGAGMMPTANAVVGDIIDIARNLLFKTSGRVPLLSYQKDKIAAKPVLPIKDITASYYFKFLLADKPKVLSTISGILGNYDISIKYVQQKGSQKKGYVPVVIITHTAKEEKINAALKDITSLDIVSDEYVMIRIEE
jgi:homoserine dehydrogenase